MTQTTGPKDLTSLKLGPVFTRNTYFSTFCFSRVGIFDVTTVIKALKGYHSISSLRPVLSGQAKQKQSQLIN